MRFWFSGPRIMGVRTGVSFGPEDFGSRRQRSSRMAGPSQPSEAPSGGFVYVIRSDANVVKIGFSSNPINRIASLRTGSSYPLDFAFVGVTPGTGAEIEQEAHRILARHRLEGEWFDVTPEMATAAVMGAAAKIGHKLHPVAANQVGDIIAIASGVKPMPGTDRSRVGAYAWTACLWFVLVILTGVEINLGMMPGVVLAVNGIGAMLVAWACFTFL